MEPLLVYPDPVPPELAQALDLAGYPWKAVADEAAVGARRARRRLVGRRRAWPPTTPRAPSRCAGRCASATCPLEPLLLLVSGAQLADLELRDDLFDDFCLHPFQPRELEARLKHLFWRTGTGHPPGAGGVRRRCSSTSRPTRPPSPASRSTSPTWSTSC